MQIFRLCGKISKKVNRVERVISSVGSITSSGRKGPWSKKAFVSRNSTFRDFATLPIFRDGIFVLDDECVT